MSDLPYGPFGFPNVRAWGMAPPINVQDDLEASATPLAVEPTVRPKRKKAPATDQGVAAFDAVFQDVGGDYNKAVQVFADELTAGGVAPARAVQAAMARMEQHQSLSRDPNIFFEEMGTPLPTSRQTKAPQGGASQPVPFGAMPDADPRTTRAERLAGVDETAARWERQKAAYDRATGLGAPDAISEEEGPYPGAGRPGYDRTFTPDELAGQRAAQEDAALAERQRWADTRNDNIEAKYGPAARSVAEAGDADGVTDYAATQTARERFRNEQRRRYEMDAREGSDAARDEIVQQDERGAEARKKFREAVANAPKSSDPRMERYKAQMMLAGANPAKNAVNAFTILTPEQQQDVIATRMKFGQRDGGKSDEWDRRLDMMRIQMENDRTEREKDRTMTREERQAAREADERRFAEERARREQEWKERSAQFDRDFALRQEQLTREAEANRQRHEQGMAGVSAQIEALRQRGAQGDAEMELKRAEAQRVADALQAAERTKRVAAESLRYGPGVEELMSGNYGTPGAQEALANIAAESDQSWTGFYHSDARRLDAELARLGITDPEARRQLVEQYGLGGMSSGSGGGRSGVISGLVNWMSGDYR